MKTLKTIAILPVMVLLVACGGGGGYSGAIPDVPVFTSNVSVTALDNGQDTETQTFEATDSKPDNGNTSTTVLDNTNPPVPNTVHLSFGHWDATWRGCNEAGTECNPEKSWANNQLVYGVHPDTGNLTVRVIYPNKPIDSTFDGAVYNGHSVIEKTVGEFINGDVKVDLTETNEGRFRIDFSFSEMDGVPDLDYTIQNYNPASGHRFKTDGFEHPGAGNKFPNGVRGRFSGRDNEFISGAFGGEGMHIGVFGTCRPECQPHLRREKD